MTALWSGTFLIKESQAATPELGVCVQRPSVGKASTARLTEVPQRLLAPFTYKEVETVEKTSDYDPRDRDW